MKASRTLTALTLKAEVPQDMNVLAELENRLIKENILTEPVRYKVRAEKKSKKGK